MLYPTLRCVEYECPTLTLPLPLPSPCWGGEQRTAIWRSSVVGGVQSGPRAQEAVKRFSVEPTPVSREKPQHKSHSPVSLHAQNTNSNCKAIINPPKLKNKNTNSKKKIMTNFKTSNHRALNSKYRPLLSLRPCRTPN